jgi:hypothetical protein
MSPVLYTVHYIILYSLITILLNSKCQHREKHRLERSNIHLAYSIRPRYFLALAQMILPGKHIQGVSEKVGALLGVNSPAQK